jgi:hypothetical protein
LGFASDDVPKLAKRALFAHWKYERRRRTKRRQAQINPEPNKLRRRRKTSAAGGKSKRRRPRNQTQGASEHENPLANAARKLSRAFAKACKKGKQKLKKNEGVRLWDNMSHLCSRP